MEAGPATMTNSSSSSSSSRSPPLGAKSASFRLHSPSFNTLHLRPYKSPTSMAERTQDPPSTSHRRSFSSEESRNRALIMEIAPATTTDSSSSSSSSRRPPLGAKSASFRLHSPSFNTLRLRRIFDLFDKNGDGLTTPEELSRALALHQSIHEAFFRGNDDDKAAAAAAAAAAAGGSPSSREKEYQCEAFKVIQRQQLGKAVLNFAITMATGLLFNPYQRLTHLQACAVAIALSIGVATTWNGMLLHEFCPRVANALECFGACTIFLAFFGLVSSFLPPSLMWVCWLCGGLLFLPLVLPTAVERSAGRLDSGQATNVEIKSPTSLCGNELQITIEENNESRSAQSSRRKGKEASQR